MAASPLTARIERVLGAASAAVNSDFVSTLGPLARTVLDAARQVDTESQAWAAQDVANAEKL